MNSIDISAMPRRNPRRFRFPLRPLATAFALAQMASTALAGVTHVVTTCDDAPVLPTCNGIDDGTLRQAFNCAQDGDTVDLTQLQCSTITLSAPLTSGPVGLTLSGPGAQYLTLTANNQFRPLAHNGRPDDTMLIIGLTISNGSYDNPYTYRTGGGCVFSSGNVYLFGTEVTSCSTSATSAVATGGAIFAKGTVTLAASAVSGSTATGALADVKYAVACGGGIYADTVKVQSSVLSGNAAASHTGATYGGGVCATHFDAKYSTISENIATSRAGVAAGESFALTNSTISGNTARDFTGGAHLASGTAEIYNSTIAFNSAGAADGVGGITALAMHLESSIIARNTAAGIESDIGTLADGISGSHNLIMVSNVPGPADTIVDDPLLGPLQGNGGLTPTHALPVDSPAIDRGSNLQALEADQRLQTRVFGKAPDIGAVEFFDRIFGNAFELPED